jgi:hypothetical protein
MREKQRQNCHIYMLYMNAIYYFDCFYFRRRAPFTAFCTPKILKNTSDSLMPGHPSNKTHTPCVMGRLDRSWRWGATERRRANLHRCGACNWQSLEHRCGLPSSANDGASPSVRGRRGKKKFRVRGNTKILPIIKISKGGKSRKRRKS